MRQLLGYVGRSRFSISHFPFFIRHLEPHRSESEPHRPELRDVDFNDKWKMENDNWKICLIVSIRMPVLHKNEEPAALSPFATGFPLVAYLRYTRGD